MCNKQADQIRGQMIYVLTKAAQRRFGKARFELGALLHEIKTQDLWKGRAASFAAFLEEERINSSAAYTYMRVAKRLFCDLNLSDKDFDKLATVNMNVLDIAIKVIKEGNKDEIIDILSVLGERDAKQEMLERIDSAEPVHEDKPRPQRSRQVTRVLANFYDLPDDQRIEFLASIQPNCGQISGLPRT